MKKLIHMFFAGWVMFFALPVMAYVTGTPVPTDSRIKTFVYNANDVYRVLTHYGYQMNIEFGDEEEIETISVGDRSGWQITPDGNRLFVRAMDDKAHTNMTVITEERTYQFDLYSAKPGEQGWDELVYVVRFYYPPETGTQFAASQPAAPMMTGFPMTPVNAMPAPPPMNMPMIAPPAPMPPMPMASAPLLPPMAPPALAAPTMPPMMAPTPMPMPAPAMPPMAMAPAPMMPPMMAPPALPTPSIAPPALPSLPMGTPLYSPALPPVAPPPMATPQIMSRPATTVPPVNIARKPFGMIVPPHMAVAPPPRMPHPRAPFVANEMTKGAQRLARKYPKGSYKNPVLAPRMLPSLERILRPEEAAELSASQMNVSPMGLPLPSTAPGGYIQF